MDVAAPTLDPGPSREAVAGGPLEARWLGRIGYRDAWALQHDLVERRIAGEVPDQLLLLEHLAVLTLGRQAEERHVLAPPAELAARGIELIRVERGGEVTYHGPGQLVAYPILALSRRGLLVRPLVRALEAAMVGTCAAFGVEAGRRDGHPGCWCDGDGAVPRKIGALGLRIERGVSYHGIALNVAPDLADFDLIDPCGMPGVVSTSIAHEFDPSRMAPGRRSRAHAPGDIALSERDPALRILSDPSRFDARAGITGNRGLAEGVPLGGRGSERVDPRSHGATHGPTHGPTDGTTHGATHGPTDGTTHGPSTPVDAPEGIGRWVADAAPTHENAASEGHAPTGIDPDGTTPELSVEVAARIFARALAGHLGAALTGFAAQDATGG